jgi:hypothetical protein
MTDHPDRPATPPGRRRGGLAAGSARSYRPGFRQLPELRSELIRRATTIRNRGDLSDPRIAQTEEANGRWMTAVLDRFGWPGWAAVGTDGARAAWMVAQHGSTELRSRALPLLAAAVIVADADPVCLAYLIDRVLVTDGRPQLFGTQYEYETGRGLRRCPVDHPQRVAYRLRHLGIDTAATDPPVTYVSDDPPDEDPARSP